MQNKTLHGVFVSINNIGVIITGEPGIGKSHAALMLLDRGHKFIADDIIEIHNQQGTLLGRCPDKLDGLLKVRGLNIINIADVFNENILMKQHPIDFIINLAEIDDENINDLHGTSDTVNILGVSLPRITLIPSYSNMALMIELAVKNYQPNLGEIEQLVCA